MFQQYGCCSFGEGVFYGCKYEHKWKKINCVCAVTAEASMSGRGSVQRFPRWLQTVGPAGGDEQSAHCESPPQISTLTCFTASGQQFYWSNWPTFGLCFAESGERQRNVSAQEQHWESPFLSEKQIGKWHKCIKHKLLRLMLTKSECIRFCHLTSH